MLFFTYFIVCLLTCNFCLLVYRCDGHQQCSVPVNNDLGDPCPDTEKYLDIEYECTEKTAGGQNLAHSFEIFRMKFSRGRVKSRI